MRIVLLLLLGLVLGGALYWGLIERGSAPAATQPVAAAVDPALQANDALAQERASAGIGQAPATPAALQGTPQAPVAEAIDAPPPPRAPPVMAAAPAALVPAAMPDGGGLLLPVQGLRREQLQDTFTDARSEGRVHDAIDIMAAAGTPVLAVADGTVEKLFDSKRGGLTIYQFEPSGRYAYYYAHLQRYADGLAEKQTLRRGDVIGYVGSTGNANPEAPHLHFAIFRLGPERHWWEGEAINPYPVLHDGQPL